MTCRKMYIGILCFHVPFHEIATAKMVVMLPEGTEFIRKPYSLYSYLESVHWWLYSKFFFGGFG